MPFATFHSMIAYLYTLRNSAQYHLFRKLSLPIWTPFPFVPRTLCRMLSEHSTVWISYVSASWLDCQRLEGRPPVLINDFVS